MSTEQTSTLPPTLTAPRPAVPTAAPTVTPPPHFAPPRLTKMGKVADLTQGGLGGSLDFP